MSFQILNSEDQPITLYELDKEAAEFWDVKMHDKYYAIPKQSPTTWFDSIGFAIHHPEKYTKGWNDIKCTLWTIQSRSLYDVLMTRSVMNIKVHNIREYLTPYYKLIDYWEAKGYKPKQIEE